MGLIFRGGGTDLFSVEHIFQRFLALISKHRDTQNFHLFLKNLGDTTFSYFKSHKIFWAEAQQVVEGAIMKLNGSETRKWNLNILEVLRGARLKICVL